MRLAKLSISAATWNIAGLIGDQAINFIRLAILARLLGPGDFGIYAMVMVIFLFITNAGDFGTTAAVVKSPRTEIVFISSIFWLNVLLGLTLSIIAFLLSPLLASIYSEPKILNLGRCISTIFIISGFGYLHLALLQKSLNFKAVASCRLIANLISSIVVILLVLKGMNYMAFGVHIVLHAFLLTSLYWWSSKLVPKLTFKVDELKKLKSFVINLTAFNYIDYFANNVDKFIIGKVLGNSSMGLYYIGFRMVLIPAKQFVSSFKNVVFSAMSKVQENQEKLQKIFFKVEWICVVVFAPICVLLISSSDLIVNLLLGDDWSSSALVISILAPCALMQAIMSPAGILCMIRNKTNILLNLGIFSLVLNTVFISIGVRYGFQGAAFGYLLGMLIIFPISLHRALPLIGLHITDLFRTISRPLYGALAALFVCVLSKKFVFEDRDLLPLSELLFSIVLLSIVFIPWIWTQLRHEFNELKLQS